MTEPRPVHVVEVPLPSNSDAYTFTGPRGTIRWPKALSALGAGGAWNWAWRLGLEVLSPERSDERREYAPDLVLVHLGAAAGPALAGWLEQRQASGACTIVTGTVAGVSSVVGPAVRLNRVTLRATQGLGAIDATGTANIHSSPSAEVFALDSPPGTWHPVERLAGIGGERHTPHRALVEPIERAPAALVRGSTIVLNAEPFSAYQAWLQGHEDLQTWLAWRPRLAWLDHFAVDLAKLIERCVPDALLGVAGARVDLPDATLVLRHDLDHSRDTSMFDFEVARGVAASHAVLLDSNTRFWLERVSHASGHEASFHYNTAREPGIVARVGRQLLNGAPLPIQPNPRAITRGGLARQLDKARRCGMRPRTLMRHLPFIYYPELIDALAALPGDIVGGSSFFRGHVLRFGQPPTAVRAAAMGDSPDTQFPTLWPFRPFDAASGKLLPLFEGTCVMEAEPELVDQLLGDAAAGRALRKVIVATYHPAHANTDTIRPGGTLPWLQRLIDLAGRRGVPISTLAHVYARCHASLEHPAASVV